LLVGVDYVRLLGRHFLALDDSEAGSRWRVGSGGGGCCGCCCCGSAGDARCYGDAVVVDQNADLCYGGRECMYSLDWHICVLLYVGAKV
jgi:hypothetical protein